MQGYRYGGNPSLVSSHIGLSLEVVLYVTLSYPIVVHVYHLGEGKVVCWRLDERGSVGETPLHVCLLKATSIHANLAKRMVKKYPKLVHDFYIHDEFYGN